MSCLEGGRGRRVSKEKVTSSKNSARCAGRAHEERGAPIEHRVTPPQRADARAEAAQKGVCATGKQMLDGTIARLPPARYPPPPLVAATR